MAIENLRRESRVEARVHVTVLQRTSTRSLETSDVSFKGLFIQTAETFALRSLVRLRVKLPSGEIEAHAMVVHVVASTSTERLPGVGMQFWGLAGSERRAWDDFVRDTIQERRRAAKITTGKHPIVGSESDPAISTSGVGTSGVHAAAPAGEGPASSEAPSSTKAGS